MEPGSRTLEAADPSLPEEEVSLLFPAGPSAGVGESVQGQPEYFPDLNLDQFVAAVTAGREEYDLARFFCAPVSDEATVSYRQEVFLDLEDQSIFSAVAAFAERMRDVRAHLAQSEKLRYPHQAESWFVDAVGGYCDAVLQLAQDVCYVDLSSRAMSSLRSYLARYAGGERFASLVSATRQVREALAQVHYCVNVKGGRVAVAKYESEADYSAEVLATFQRFKQGAVNDYRATFREPTEMNHVEASVLQLVARHYPAEFGLLDEFCAMHREFVDPVMSRFDLEVQFYMAYLEYIAPLRATGLCFCYPTVRRGAKEVFARESFDLVLAVKLTGRGTHVVCNDLSLSGPERVLVVSGPNQGGKTTFARMFGQLHHLANIGCPVPGEEAGLYLFEGLYTHFEREEDLGNATGKLEDELRRAKRILTMATTDSLVVLNEPFSSTTLEDSLFLGRKVMERLVELDVLGVFVTFVEELSSFGPSTVSMVSTVVPDNPAERTYKVVRRRADGLAYALALAEKYRVSYEALRERLAP
jgi:DNA mismatch repair protein MutS